MSNLLGIPSTHTQVKRIIVQLEDGREFISTVENIESIELTSYQRPDRFLWEPELRISVVFRVENFSRISTEQRTEVVDAEVENNSRELTEQENRNEQNSEK